MHSYVGNHEEVGKDTQGKSNFRESFRCLSVPNEAKSVLSILIDWGIIFFAYYLILNNLIFLPISILLIGSRQRALSNLSHDASHGNLFRNTLVNDLISNLFCAFPMLETVDFYRKSHIKHHQFLGDVEKDPDSKAHLKYGYDDSRPWKGNPFHNFVVLIFNTDSIKNSLLGSLFNLSRNAYITLVLWWGIIFYIISSLDSFQTSLFIFGIWFISKLTAYHVIRIFAEFLDHSGLERHSVLSFTRNLPHSGFLRYFFHPNCDTYHIVHHLHPKIPHYNLEKADRLLISRNDYLSGHHCDSYFFGSHSAVNCWVGRCRGRIP